MEYSIKELSELAGVSARTLRYYDEIGLLKPSGVNDAGYRYYGEREVESLQQILFYRERGFELKTIQKIIYDENFDMLNAMEAESEAIKEIVELHKEWLCMTWKQYSVEAHKGVAMMYIADERFTKYYDRKEQGCAKLLCEAVQYWAGK